MHVWIFASGLRFSSISSSACCSTAGVPLDCDARIYTGCFPFLLSVAGQTTVFPCSQTLSNKPYHRFQAYLSYLPLSLSCFSLADCESLQIQLITKFGVRRVLYIVCQCRRRLSALSEVFHHLLRCVSYPVQKYG